MASFSRIEPQYIAGLVSTIIPVFNRPLQVREAVASVVAQSWRPIEIIVVDDGSTDTTPDVLVSLENEYRPLLRVLRQPNAGPGAARQCGVDASRGEFVQYLDSDDVYLPDKTAKLVGRLLADADADIAYCNCSRRLADGSVRDDHDHRAGEGRDALFPAILEGRIWASSAPLYRRRFLDAGPRWPVLRQCEDWLYDAFAGAARARLTHVPEGLVELRTHDGGHLGHGWQNEPALHAQRCQAILGVLAQASLAGVHPSEREMRHFVRTLFFEAREAGRLGRDDIAMEFLAAARRQAVERRWQIDLFRMLVSTLGGARAARVVELMR